ncbi:hypothetical protein PUN28_007136 [Cardiocondyla obscurior]|uniref:Uncharacterized protein n=1 Tax=Cardiocondyla obscurior TaxID=286306 RepID=A0AAW2G3S3_9HYME
MIKRIALALYKARRIPKNNQMPLYYVVRNDIRLRETSDRGA